MERQIDSRAKLADDTTIPWFGLGVFQATAEDEARNAVEHALACGYRHIDTAAIYRNEAGVGLAVRQSGLARDQVFITTKVWNNDHGYQQAIDACKCSLDTLGLDYVDLYLIHWPVEGKRHDTWRALMKLREDGLCRSIGVSNYTIRHLQELMEQTPEHIPVINQVEFHPFLYQSDLLHFCREYGIQLEAYTPLVRGRRFGHTVVGAIAAAHGKTEAQVLIRWALQHDLVVIPKSSNPERIVENGAVFDFALTDAEMGRLDALDEQYRVAWDPTNAP